MNRHVLQILDREAARPVEPRAVFRKLRIVADRGIKVPRRLLKPYMLKTVSDRLTTRSGWPARATRTLALKTEYSVSRLSFDE